MSSGPPDTGTGVAARWAGLRTRVATAARAAGRNPDEVAILLAAKTMPAATLREAVLAGAHLLGQNRVQELVEMAPDLADLTPSWHMIGRLQSNKVNAAVRWADAVQSVADLPLAVRLSRRCAALDRELEVWVQVNVSGETTKGGVAPEAAVDLAAGVAALPGLRLAGLMTIGARSDDAGLVRAGYARLAELGSLVRGSGAPGTDAARGLSMGMSGDLELAIAEGATLVRVGSAVFGPRRT